MKKYDKNLTNKVVNDIIDDAIICRLKEIHPVVIRKIIEGDKEHQKLVYFKDTSIGLWVTDKPDKIPKEIKKKYFWRLK